MKANELRIGNHIEYFMEDSQDERKIWWELDVVDAQTILQLETYPDDSDYRPIILTEEKLIKSGFELKGRRYSNGWFYLWKDDSKIVFALAEMQENTGTYLHIEYYHQLQNLYFSLTGEELNYKD